MRKYKNAKGTAYRRGKNLQLTRKVKNSKTSEQIYSKNWPKYGGSLKACFVDADFDGVNDSVRSKYRSPALSKDGDPCHPVPDSLPIPISGPTNINAAIVVPPISGPTNISASVLPPISGPTNISASVLPPVSGPTNINAAIAVPPISGPTNITASVLPPVSGPTNISASVLPPISGPTNINALVTPPVSGPTNISASVLPPISGPTNINALVTPPVSAPTNISASVLPPVSAPTNISASVLPPVSGPSNISASVLPPVSGPSNINAAIVVPPISGPTNITALVSPPISGPTNISASAAPPTTGPSELVALVLDSEPGAAQGVKVFTIMNSDMTQNSSYTAFPAPNDHWNFVESTRGKSISLDNFFSQYPNRSFFAPDLIGGNPAIVDVGTTEKGIHITNQNVFHRTKMQSVDANGADPITTPNEGALFLVIKTPANFVRGTILSLESHRIDGSLGYHLPKIHMSFSEFGHIECIFNASGGTTSVLLPNLGTEEKVLLSLNYKFDDSSGFATLNKNGVPGPLNLTSLASARSISTSFSSDYYLEDYIGANHSNLNPGFPLNVADNFTDFTLLEYVEAPSPQSSSDVGKIEGYLAHKWGLETELPSSHAYKTTAPTF